MPVRNRAALACSLSRRSALSSSMSSTLIEVAAMTGATIAAAVAGRAAWVRAAAGLITAGAAIALWGAVSVQDPAAPRWHGSLLVPGSLVISLSVAVPLLAPRLVPRAAVGRIGALAGGLAALVLAWSLGKGMVP